MCCLGRPLILIRKSLKFYLIIGDVALLIEWSIGFIWCERLNDSLVKFASMLKIKLRKERIKWLKIMILSLLVQGTMG